MSTTLGKPVIMGRKTLESMKAPLPGRTNIVLTTNPEYRRDGIKVVHDLDSALRLGQAQCEIDGQDEIMVIGGADIYALAMPVATRLYITHVEADVEGDVFFPEFDMSHWHCLSSESFPQDERHSAPFSVAVYERA